jgi:hypothetical protein
MVSSNYYIFTPTSVSSKIYWFITTDKYIYTQFCLVEVVAVVVGGERCFIIVYPLVILCQPWTYRIIGF